MKPHLVFVSPTLPAFGGHGAAMRAGTFIEAFSEIYDVTLVVVDLWRRTPHGESTLLAKCKAVHEFSQACLVSSRRNGQKLCFAARPVDHLHVFRLIMCGFVGPYLTADSPTRPFCTLDLDDYESKLATRLARLSSAVGDTRRSEMFLRRADRFTTMESEMLPRFDQVYVCHRSDAIEIQKLYNIRNVHTVPNTVRLPLCNQRSYPEFSAQILFVGTLDYFPNEDGLTWFCTDILPIIRREMWTPISLLIVGSRPSKVVQSLASIVNVTIKSDVDDLNDYYLSSSISIVPIRAAGGTRLKILEALSYSLPVVSTTFGAEGLDLKSGRHIEIADASEDFADQCIKLLRDGVMRQELAARGLRWLKANHTTTKATKVIRELSEARKDNRHGSILMDKLEFC